MTMILNRSNIQFTDYRENEVCMSLSVMEENTYCMSPTLALELALLLETEARKVIFKQQVALQNFGAKKAAQR